MSSAVGIGSEAIIIDEQIVEENQDDAIIIPLRTAKLLKLRHNIKKLREEVLSKFSNEMKECKEACSAASILIGELNDNIAKEGE
ncbi:hypothetical protein LCGC14_0469750 [marine sediment metagenome]|uniref:Uncharacterized protein n=1 Tax=marine sediment metagenome TaxID=412755 RepID=A0A0F9SCN1_9ZZZZ